MALTIPLQAVPSQQISCALANQACQLKVYQKSTGMFADVYVNNELIIGGVLCENRNRIVRDAYLGFIGDLEFVDTQGSDDPTYTGLGLRFLFVYLEESDFV
jgi:hypothetical protein